MGTRKPYYCCSLGGFDFDLAHIAGMVAFAALYNGPANAIIYPWYARVFKGRTNLCIALDQTFYMPLIVVPVCWYINGAVSNWAMRDPRNTAESIESDAETLGQDGLASNSQKKEFTFQQAMSETTVALKKNWWSNVLWTWVVWIPAESVNMRWTPVHLRSPVAGLSAFIYLTGMAVWTHLL